MNLISALKYPWLQHKMIESLLMKSFFACKRSTAVLPLLKLPLERKQLIIFYYLNQKKGLICVCQSLREIFWI